MSTVTVVRKNGVAAIAADTLTKWGEGKESAKYVSNNHKIMRVGANFLGVTGSATAQLALEDYFANKKNPAEFNTVAEIFRTWLALHNILKETYYLNPSGEEKDAFETSQSDILIANAHGIFGVSEHRTVQEYSRFYAYGSGYAYAVGAMYAVYEDPARTAEEIARLGVEAAAEFHDGTGLPVESFAVTLDADG